jgi:hypothetical protein
VGPQRQIGIAHEVGGEPFGEVILNAPRTKQSGEFLSLEFWVFGDSLSLDFNFVVEEFLLRLYRKVLTAGH